MGLQRLGLWPQAEAVQPRRAVPAHGVPDQARGRVHAVEQGEGIEPADLRPGPTAGLPLVLVQQPGPFQVMPRLDMGAGAARGRSPVRAEELAQRAGRRVEQVAAEQPDQGMGMGGVVGIARGFVQCQHGFQQVHVRVLLARPIFPRQGVVVAGGRMRHVVRDPVQGAAGLGHRRFRLGQAGIPSQGKQHEGQVVQVRCPVQHRPVRM